jgi:flagellar basal body rod protein FlgC
MSTLGSAVRASASALTAERMRIEVAVSNLANAE